MSLKVLAQAFSDPSGADHPEAVWIPATVIMDNVERSGSVQWYCYHDAPALLTGKAPVQGGQHQTLLDGALYGQVVSLPVPAGSYGDATSLALVTLAMTVKDADSGQKDADGNPVLIPFFASATVVTLGA